MAAILIVDDDPVQRRLLEAMVRRFGYEAITADEPWRRIEPTELAAAADPTTPTPTERMATLRAVGTQ